MPRAVVTGGAGFLGSHLSETLLASGWDVVAIDNLSTGSLGNVAHLRDDPRFTLLEHDIVQGIPLDGPLAGRVDAVLHFASPASPPAYLARGIETLEVGAIGTQHALELTRANDGARFLLASTSEVYGDPLVDPQTESYWGNVNPIGPRSVYDEAKRYAEAITMAYHRTYGLDTHIVRIFNTYGPRLAPGDGRVVSNFLTQAIRGEPLSVYGDGLQTRSFCYVDDEVRGLLALLDAPYHEPVNIGNPDEFTVLELAELVHEVTGTTTPIVHEAIPVDDPRQRRPDITLARELLGWAPTVDLADGFERSYSAYLAAARG
jgi:dTDP-glucose 4,6-dehydratase